MSAHTIVLANEWKQKTHTLPEFQNMTCYQIIHSVAGHVLWEQEGGMDGGIPYAPQTSHPIYKQLRKFYGWKKKKKNKGHLESPLILPQCFGTINLSSSKVGLNLSSKVGT